MFQAGHYDGRSRAMADGQCSGCLSYSSPAPDVPDFLTHRQIPAVEAVGSVSHLGFSFDVDDRFCQTGQRRIRSLLFLQRRVEQ